MDIQVRPFEREDFSRLLPLMPPEWMFPGCTPEETEAQATMDFAGMLVSCPVRLVATAPAEEGEVPAIAGVLIARLAGGEEPDDAGYWGELWERAAQVLAAGGPGALAALAYERQLGDRADLLIEAAGTERRHDTELELFVAAPNVRGTGVGTALMEQFQGLLARSGERGFWLQTDSTCSWEWYEKHGYTRVAAIDLDGRFSMPPHEGTVQAFMYRCDL